LGSDVSIVASDLSTDLEWEEWGRRDPYFGVITDPKFRRPDLTEQAVSDFFNSGDWHVQHILGFIRHHLVPAFTPARVLDFGCGVGRTLVPFAAIAQEVVGVDVSPSMLQEARINCATRGAANVSLLLSDDTLSTLTGDFDLVHSFIVFQHIPVARGRAIFARLLAFLRPGGIGALHLTYAKSRFADNYGAAPAELAPQTGAPEATTPDAGVPPPASATEAAPDPEMQMNSYSLNDALFSLQRSGVVRFHADFTDHGGELGVFLFFQAPAHTTPPPKA
jgi:SAM-dependent methyltransferase